MGKLLSVTFNFFPSPEILKPVFIVAVSRLTLRVREWLLGSYQREAHQEQGEGGTGHTGLGSSMAHPRLTLGAGANCRASFPGSLQSNSEM